MADRQVKVTLIAQANGYISAMDAAARSTRTLGTEAEKLAQKRRAFEDLGRPLVAFGAIAAAAVGLAVAKFAEFDAAMSNVQAATQESADNMDLLRAAALDAGAATVFTATEAANAIEELGKNGLTTSQILKGGLSGALDLASAGQLSVARAAEVAAVSMKQFGLQGADIPHIADLLAAGAGKAAGDVEDLSQALNQSALVAKQTGLSIEETTGILAAFADAGLVGSDAGTSLKSALQRLTPISQEAADEMERLGISAYDQGGQFIGAAAFAGNLRDSLKNLTDEQRNAALAQIFGSDAVRAANVLYKEGADGIQRYIDQTTDSGYAAKVAADRLDNLKGDLEKLGGAFDTYLIQSGSGANDVLRLLTQTATGLVDAVGNLPTPLLGVGLGLGAIVAAMALASGGFLLLTPRIAAAKLAMAELGISAGSAARGIGLVGGALAVAGAYFAYFAAKQGEAVATQQEFAESLDKTNGSITNYTLSLLQKKLAESGAFEAAERAGVSQKELTDAIIQGGNALDTVQKKLSGTNTIASFFTPTGNGIETVGVKAGLAGQQLNELSDGLAGARDQLATQAEAANGSSASTQSASDAYKTAADQAAALESNLSALIDTINKANGVGQDAVSTNSAYQSALDDVRTAVSEFAAANGVSAANLDQNTVAGAANADMFADLAAKSQAAAQAQFDLDGNVTNFRTTLEAGRQALYDQILGLTDSAEAAQAFTDKVYAIPSEKEFTLIAETGQAQAAIDNFIRTNDGRTISVNVGYNPQGENSVIRANGGMDVYASGGVREGIYRGGSNIIKFAEPETGWETYISGRPGFERQNIGYALESLARLGYNGFASTPSTSGGVTTNKFDIDVTGVEKEAAAELIFQRLAAGLATR